MYKFSAPMPYTKDDIQKLLNINNQVEKSKITTLSFSLPSSCELFSGFEQYRNHALQYSNFEYWKKLIVYSLDCNADFIYLLNSSWRLFIEDRDFQKQLLKLDKLLFELQKIGVNKLRVSEHRLIDYISKNYPYFGIYASTSFEFKSLAEYKNFKFMHPNVKQIVPSHDSIKNFTFLKNLKSMLSDTEIELMINEGCINGCPNRLEHISEKTDRIIIYKNDLNLSNYYWTSAFCNKFENIYPFYTLTKSNIIYPWEIDEYAKIGINKFKFVGRGAYTQAIKECINMYLMYLKGIDDIKNIEDEPVTKFIFHFIFNPKLKILTVKDLKKHLPKINHFKKKGELCSAVCGVECRYCYNCAEKIEKIYKKKQEEIKKRTIPMCVITK